MDPQTSRRTPIDVPSESTRLASVLEGLLKFGFGIGGLLSLANGIWMLSAPGNWFEVFPGAVPDTGPFNAHFVRDLGGWYAAGGVLLLFALTRPVRFGGVALIVTIITYAAHAAAHIADLVTGRLPASHWVTDLPFVFAPLIGWALMLWIWWSLQSARFPELSRAEINGEEEEETESFDI